MILHEATVNTVLLVSLAGMHKTGRLLWRNKTCSAHTLLIMSIKIIAVSTIVMITIVTIISKCAAQSEHAVYKEATWNVPT